jgi:hypothetical protein
VPTFVATCLLTFFSRSLPPQTACTSAQVKHLYLHQQKTMPPPLPDILYALEPVAWFLATLPLFYYSLQQPPSSRWKLLIFHILLPVQWFRKSDRLALLLPGCVFFVAMTALVAVVHLTSALMLERWTLAELRKTCPGRSDIAVVVKAWMNSRRSPLERRPGERTSWSQRARFAGRKISEMAVLGTMCIFLEGAILVSLQPSSDDFTEQQRGYFHLQLDRQALLRFCLAFHWAWPTILFSQTLHNIMAILFVAVIPLDHPDDWPPLYGSPRHAYSLRRFWSVFWHKIAAPSQAVYGRFISRRIFGIKEGVSAEKCFVAFWVFAFSGICHALVNSKVDPETRDAFMDSRFLLLNFCGGFVEALADGLVPWNVKRRVPPLGRKMMGFVWMYAFFYCTVPSYQWAEYHKLALERERGSFDVYVH